MLWKKEAKKKKDPLPISEEYLSSVCEVKTISNELVATGAITEITPDYIQISDRGSTMLALRFGSTVKINIFNSRLGFRVLEGKVYLSTQQFLRVVELNSLLDREQRSSFRVRTNIRGKVFRAGELSRSVQGTPIVVEDLSVGGALLRSSERFGRGEHLVVQFMLVNLMMQLGGVVCRVGAEENGSTKYGFAFDAIPEAQQDALCAYLFRRQREQLNQRRG